MTKHITVPDIRMSGEEFRSRLRELGRSDAAFANEIGCSARSVSRWVRNGPPPEVAYLVDLLATLELYVGTQGRQLGPSADSSDFDVYLERLLEQATEMGERTAFLQSVSRWVRRAQGST